MVELLPTGIALPALLARSETTFTDRTAEYGLAFEGYATQAAFFDYDNTQQLQYVVEHRIDVTQMDLPEVEQLYKDSKKEFDADPEFADRAQHLTIPTIALAVGAIAGYSRYQRNAMLDVLASVVTGEPLPVTKRPGDKAIGATINTSGSLVIRSEKVVVG